METNPESVDSDLLSLFAETGVTRVSLGVQSFDPRILAAMGRRNDARAALAACELLAASWGGELSFDLIAGYPGQDVRDAEADVRTALSFDPGHLSLYSLILEEGTRLEAEVRSGRVTLPSDEAADRSWLAGRDVLLAAGYRHYEISNFARPEKKAGTTSATGTSTRISDVVRPPFPRSRPRRDRSAPVPKNSCTIRAFSPEAAGDGESSERK